MSRNPKVVGLDPSWTSFGIAHGDGSTERITTKAQDDQRIRRKVLIAAATSACWRADLVVIEGYSYASRQGREFLGYLGESLRDAIDDIGAPRIDIAPSSLKKWATGNPRASKEEMVAAAVAHLGLSERATNDEADALWLREAGRHLLGASDRIPPSANADALKKIQLPEGLQ